MRHPALVTDVWAPLAIVAPMLFATGWVETSVRGAGWLALGGPVAAGWIALAAVLVVHPASTLAAPPLRRVLMAVAGAGLVLLLLGAAGVLTIWVGQCAFAIAAVLLWVSTPPPDEGDDEDDHAPARTAIAMLVALAAALGQGVIAWRLDPILRPVSAGLAMGYAAIALCAASAAGPSAALRTGLWSAVLGILLALGTLAFAQVVPAAIQVARGGRAPVSTEVAEGFAALAPEAVGLLVLAAAPWLAPRLARGLRRPAGALLLVAVAAHVALRLREIGV
jgi:hypothetical protein